MRPRRGLAGTCVSEHSRGGGRTRWEFPSCPNTPWTKRKAVFRKSSPPPRGVNASSSPETASRPSNWCAAERKRRGGIDWDRLDADRRRDLGKRRRGRTFDGAQSPSSGLRRLNRRRAVRSPRYVLPLRFDGGAADNSPRPSVDFSMRAFSRCPARVLSIWEMRLR